MSLFKQRVTVEMSWRKKERVRAGQTTLEPLRPPNWRAKTRPRSGLKKQGDRDRDRDRDQEDGEKRSFIALHVSFFLPLFLSSSSSLLITPPLLSVHLHLQSPLLPSSASLFSPSHLLPPHPQCPALGPRFFILFLFSSLPSSGLIIPSGRKQARGV